MQDNNKGYLYLVFTSIIFGFFGVLANQLIRDISIFSVMISVYFIQAIIFFIISLTRKVDFKIHWKQLILIALFGIINSLPLYFFINAVAIENIGVVLLIQNLSTITLSMVISRIIYKEKVDFIQICLITIALLGLMVIYIPGEITNLAGIGFAILVGLFNVFANMFRKNLGQSLNIYLLSFYSSLIGLLVYILLAGDIFISEIITINSQSLLLILIYGGLNILTTIFLIKGFSILKFTIANLILMLEIIFGFILGFLFLNQSFTNLTMIGNLIIFVSLLAIRAFEKNYREIYQK